MKAMHILNTGDYSGAEHVVIDFIQSVRDTCEGVYVSREGTIQELLKKEGIEHYVLKHMSPFEIKKLLAQIKPDVIHAHDYTAGVACSVFGRRFPVISHLHNNPPWIQQKNARSFAYRMAAKRFQSILSVSEAIMDEYVFGNEFFANTKVVGNPFDASKIRSFAEDGASGEGVDVLFCGRLAAQKNPLLFLEIIFRLKERIPNIRAAMIGEGEMQGQALADRKRLHLEDAVQLHGFLRNPYKIMKNSKILCMPSLWEGFGLAALEAMSLGLPVVASPVGGLTRIVDDSCGALCLGAAQFEERIYQLLTSKDEYRHASRGALNRAELMDNAEEYADSIIRIYEDAIKNKKKAGVN